MWFDEIEKARPGLIECEYRHYSLEQGNNTNPDWKHWEQPENYEPISPQRARSRALLAFWAAEAAMNQGNDAYARFRRELFAARHEGRDKIDFTDRAAIRKLAEAAELDMSRFDQDFHDRSLLERLRDDHIEAAEKYKMFGVPTFVFENGETAFVKISDVPKGEDAVKLFEDVVKTFENRPYLMEIKRP